MIRVICPECGEAVRERAFRIHVKTRHPNTATERGVDAAKARKALQQLGGRS